ncbi:NO-inducible flavohemoprotein [Paraburkholderia phytofirmans]|uniref:Flavohemoprotein n=1 Tax=Paraburkholderia phytofirmans (strain DSM 17436 / LMG 22146 / PsJN) TaxID=398527 RepID=B2T8C8_PARPJ|nr:NO-inducible flavohemoprotein [Paraburkholderia phytofirmans]ACD20492.1 oxidoreductase FAD/NAD(P)-binding domain protein [Paraburkholderia phytofirmans PsJN]
MLSAEHRAIVKATVPLLESGGEALTTHFYDMLISEHPEVRPMFNLANQASGAQQRALANGVLMYARHIDQLEQLGGLVSQIINKHVALNILPEHYPIVGQCLLRSIREVLGAEIATDAVIEAWAAAYQQLADLLSGLEEKMYAEREAAPGGWRGTRLFRVARKVRESDEITSFYLRPADNGELLAFHPGQYIGVRLVIDGEEVRRNYSLSAMSNGEEYRISVKREANGKVSNHLHARVNENDTVELFAPAGDFKLEDSDKPLVLISGGVGITPTLAMLQAALKTDRPVHFIHSARHGGVHAFRDVIDQLAARHPKLKRFYCYEQRRAEDADAHGIGYLDEKRLDAWLPRTRDVDVYFLGPIAFMKAIKKHLKAIGVPESQSRYEFFGPASALE